MIFGFGILRNGFGCLRKEKKKEELFGEEELPWDSIWRKKKNGKKKKRMKEEDGLQELESLRLEFHVDF